MKKSEFILRIEEIVEAEPGMVKVSDGLSDIGWDSMAMLGFQSLLDFELDTRVPIEHIIACKTVGDLIAVVGAKLCD